MYTRVDLRVIPWAPIGKCAHINLNMFSIPCRLFPDTHGCRSLSPSGFPTGRGVTMETDMMSARWHCWLLKDEVPQYAVFFRLRVTCVCVEQECVQQNRPVGCSNACLIKWSGHDTNTEKGWPTKQSFLFMFAYLLMHKQMCFCVNAQVSWNPTFLQDSSHHGFE